MKNTFDWKEYRNDIHIGSNNSYKDYKYKDFGTRQEYHKKWRESKKLKKHDTCTNS